MRSFSSTWLGALLALGASFPVVAMAVSLPAAIAQKSAPEKPAVEAIEPADIPVRADIDERYIQEVMSRARRKDPSGPLAVQLDGLSRDITEMLRITRREDLGLLSAVRLDGLESHWRFFDRELGKWRRELERISEPYATEAAELAKRRSTWIATRGAIAGTGVANALGDRVRGILAQIQVAERALSVPLDQQIRLGRRANLVQANIAAGLASIDTAIAHYDRRLTTIDAPPVWRAWRDTDVAEPESQGIAAGFRMEARFLEQWGKANAERIQWSVLGALALLPALLWLARRSRTLVSDDPEMKAAAKVLRRPWSAWLVLILVGVPFWFPDAPVLMHQIALLLALIPVLRLLPPKVFDVLGRWPYVATALYVLYGLSILLIERPVHYRLYVLAVAVVAATTIAWLLYSRRTPASGTELAGTTRIAARAAGWLAVIALLVAIVANVAGNVSLAEMLTGAVLATAYIGLAFYAGTNVLTSVLRLLLARRSISRFRVVTRHAGPLLKSATRLISFAAFVSWIIVAMFAFRVARPIFAWLKDVLTHPLEAGQVSITLGSILLFGLAIWIAMWVSRTVRYVLNDELLPKMALPRGVSNSISTLSYYALLIIGLMFALAAAGFETSQFAIVFGALGVGIGFGLQNVVNNFVSGLILMFERPIQPGDVVEVSGTSGKVREIGMRATTLTTFEGADVVVPNGTLLSEKLINWTLSDMNRRLDVDVGVAYGSEPRKVLALLTETTLSTPGIAADPVPAVIFLRFSPNSIDFGVRAWTHDFGEWGNIRSELTVRIYEALTAAGIEIPFPQQTLHIKSVSEEAAARLRGTP
jgi:potassium efflux system protein